MLPKNSSTPVARLLNRSKDALFATPLLPLWRKRLSGKAMVYLYHRLGEEGEHSFLDQGGSPLTSADELRSDIKFLKNMGAKFVCFSDLASCDYASGAFYVAITIDDGFLSNYTDGLRVANEEGIPLSIFQCSAMVVRPDPAPTALIWEHQLYYLYFHAVYATKFLQQIKVQAGWPDSLEGVRETVHPDDIKRFIDAFVADHPGLEGELAKIAADLYPSVNHLLDAQSEGHEIASHGHNHFKRSNISEAEFVVELTTSRKKLEGILGRVVSAFSYPFNSYFSGDELLCARQYSMVATVDGGPLSAGTPMLKIPRNTFPGPARNKLRQRRWLLTGRI